VEQGKYTLQFYKELGEDSHEMYGNGVVIPEGFSAGGTIKISFCESENDVVQGNVYLTAGTVIGGKEIVESGFAFSTITVPYDIGFEFNEYPPTSNISDFEQFEFWRRDNSKLKIVNWDEYNNSLDVVLTQRGVNLLVKEEKGRKRLLWEGVARGHDLWLLSRRGQLRHCEGTHCRTD